MVRSFPILSGDPLAATPLRLPQPATMTTALPEGCWPIMITPYDAAGEIDCPVLGSLIGALRCCLLLCAGRCGAS